MKAYYIMQHKVCLLVIQAPHHWNIVFIYFSILPFSISCYSISFMFYETLPCLNMLVTKSLVANLKFEYIHCTLISGNVPHILNCKIIVKCYVMLHFLLFYYIDLPY
jgi:hypothetical protein